MDTGGGSHAERPSGGEATPKRPRLLLDRPPGRSPGSAASPASGLYPPGYAGVNMVVGDVGLDESSDFGGWSEELKEAMVDESEHAGSYYQEVVWDDEAEHAPELTEAELAQVDSEADRKEAGRLLEMGVIRWPREGEDLTEYQSLTTKVVRDWRRRPNWVRRSRLVGREFRTMSADTQELFAPASTLAATHAFLAVALTRKLEVCTFDFKDAYLQVEQPVPMTIEVAASMFGAVRQGTVTLVLDKLLPGQRIGASAWFGFAKDLLAKGGYTGFVKEPTLFKKDAGGSQAGVILHADDGLMASTAAEREKLKKVLREKVQVEFSDPMVGPGDEIQFLKRKYVMGEKGIVVYSNGRYLEALVKALGDSLKVRDAPADNSFLETDGSKELGAKEAEGVQGGGGIGDEGSKVVIEAITMVVETKCRTDSAACKGIANRLGCGRVRHLACGLLWVQQCVKEGRILTGSIPGVFNPADLGTKPLSGGRVRELLFTMGAVEPDGQPYGQADKEAADHKRMVSQALKECRESSGSVSAVQVNRWLPVLLLMAQAGQGQGLSLAAPIAALAEPEFAYSVVAAAGIGLVTMVVFLGIPFTVLKLLKWSFGKGFFRAKTRDADTQTDVPRPKVEPKVKRESDAFAQEYVDRCTDLQSLLSERCRQNREMERALYEVRQYVNARPPDCSSTFSSLSRALPLQRVPLQLPRSAQVFDSVDFSKREVEQSFPPCPTSWVDRAASLGSANLSPRSRVLRAWRAGQWARRVLQGQYATPLPSENLRLASRFYVVVAATRSLLFTGPFESSTRPSAPLHPLSVLPFSERGQVWIYEHASGDGAIAPALAFAPPVPDQSLSAIVVDLSVQAVAGAPERLQYYSAEEGPPEPQQKQKRSVLRLSRDDVPPPAASGMPSGSGPPKPPGPKRVTTATLASQLENLTSTLPSLVRSMDELSERQAGWKSRWERGPPRRLGAIPGLDHTGCAACRVFGDILSDSSSPVAHFSAREPSQRAKMQEELSADKGVFFAAVLQNMAKRMAPAASLSSEPAELLQQGVCLSRYWERFGGLRPSCLLAVCVEQMSMDSGRAELGYQLTWLEEPPAAMFTARSSKSAMHTRAFAPLASQRWVAIVLSYTKELDVIATKRADMRKGGAPLGSGSGAKDEDSEDTPSPSRPKRYAAPLALLVGQVCKPRHPAPSLFPLPVITPPFVERPQVDSEIKLSRCCLARCFFPFPCQPVGTCPTFLVLALNFVHEGTLSRVTLALNVSLCLRDGLALRALHDSLNWNISRAVPLTGLRDLPATLPPLLLCLRLRLTGRGAWDAEPWLQGCEVPNLEAESWSENLSLARLWSAQGLLGLVQGEPQQRYRSRVFNAFKDAIRDRQIGDRRLANIGERHMQGPSADLPPGFLLAGLVVPRFRAQVTGYCSDRKDFYHQFRVTEERASTNSLAFGYSAAELGPEVMSRSPVLWEQGAPTSSLTPCFRSLYQGDHMGVEFVLAAHASLLKYGGALLDHTSLQNHRAFPLGDTVQALVIDDLVGISVLPAACDPQGPSPVRHLHKAAGEVYQRFSVLGSPEKDVNGESLFTAIGCEIDSRKHSVRRGLVTAAAPLGRRLGLASLSLRAARLPVTSSGLVSRLTGAWTSAFLFRRCCMVVLSEAFSVANRAAEEPRQSKRPIPMSRRLAQELVLASVFSVAACADLTAEVSDRPCGKTVTGEAAGLAPEEEDLADDFRPPGLQSRHYDVLAPSFAGWLSDMLHGGWVRGLLMCPPCAVCGVGPALAYWKRCLGFLRLASALGVPCLLLLPGPACCVLGPVLERFVGSLSCERRWLAFKKLGAQEPGGLMCIHCFFDGAALDSFEGPAEYDAPSSLGASERSLLGLGLLRCFSRTFLARAALLDKPGIESVAVNDVLSAGDWAVDTVLPWKGDSHINVLELATVVALHRQLAASHADCRITVLVDSQVASAAAKGRSSSRSLSFALMRSTALQLGFGLFVAYGFAPTRLNVADDLTRLLNFGPRPLAASTSSFRRLCGTLSPPCAFAARLLLGRLFLLVAFDSPYDKHFLVSLLSGPFLGRLPGADHSRLDFDSTLDFPGEGPRLPLCLLTVPSLGPLDFCLSAGPSGRRASSHSFVLVVELFLHFFEAASSLLCLLDFDATLRFPGEGWGWFRVFFQLTCAMAVVVPSTPAEHERARRRSPVLLVADRVVRPVTRTKRERLSAAFDEWLLETHGISLRSLLDAPGDVSEKVANLLVGYGQALFRGGQPYYKYSETINAVAALKPSIRRSLTYAWDLAFAWLTEAPHCHHKAMPLGILLAVLSAALAWGWAAEAALFGLAWAGLLRPGEVLSARRIDLIPPRDAAPGTKHALLVIRNPKTRGRAARHQSARVDPANVIELLDAVFGKLPGHALLWPQSGATLRRRLEQIQERLGLVEAGKPAFDLSSFRPGGATWALNATENSELVRRRGRWLSLRVMDIYLQEVVAITYLPSLEPSTRECVDSLASQFTAILQRVIFFMSRGIPRAAWYALLRPHL
ncbi:unnamed protein product [Symbiodinium necroappetens]|uniref:Copia protein n=1 Tax=Symbiodinium necroappetens TaxID=1628268 RepID=A0A812NE93_9DINO|nr:unnamed protein product [Symbiodinium necroappetens]